MSKESANNYEKKQIEEVKTLSGAQNIIYNLPNLGLQTQFALMGTFLLTYYIIILGQPPIIIGGIYSASIFLGAFLCPVWGAICDRYSTRFGRKKTFMLFSAPFSIIVFVLIWSPPIPNTEYGTANLFLILWFVILIFLYNTMSAAFNTTYLSMIPELSTEENNRIKISIVNMLTLVMGAALGMILPFFLLGDATENLNREKTDFFYPNSLAGQQIYSQVIIYGVLISILFTICFILMMIIIKEPEYPSNNTDSIRVIFKKIISPFKDRNYRNFLMSFGLLFIAATIFQVLIINFTTFVLNLRGDEFLIIIMFASISGLISFILFNNLSNKIGLRKSMQICLIIGFLSFSSIILFLIPMSHEIIMIIGTLIVFFLIMAFVGAMIYPMAIVSDIIDKAQLNSDKNLSGSYMGTFTMVTSIATAIAILLISIFLQLFGAESSFSYIIIFFIGGILLLIGARIFRKVEDILVIKINLKFFI